MTGKLTTHVLDTAHGYPAAEVAISLWAISTTGERTLLKQTVTNQDGRTDEALLADSEFVVGTYELVFAIADYFAQFNTATPHPPFLTDIPLRFSISDNASHYHVPLLVSPWSYSTYRGS
jgi:5-hydroxyisourate hydrolase